jgi:hypothetical protein
VCFKRNERKRTRENAGWSGTNTAVEAVRRNRLRLDEEEDAMTSKWCLNCLEVKKLERFGPQKRGFIGRKG